MGDEQLQDPARPSSEGDATVAAAAGVEAGLPDVSAGELSDPELETVTGGYFSGDPDLQPGY